MLNKLDYVKLHGYEFHLVTHVVDKSLPKLCAPSRQCCTALAFSGYWTASTEAKLLLQVSHAGQRLLAVPICSTHPFRLAYAWHEAWLQTAALCMLHNACKAFRGSLHRYTKIGLLRKLLRETSRERAEWILWLDADTLLEELAFQLPFSAYDGKNFIAWGNADYLWAGDQFHGPQCRCLKILALPCGDTDTGPYPSPTSSSTQTLTLPEGNATCCACALVTSGRRLTDGPHDMGHVFCC